MYIARWARTKKRSPGSEADTRVVATVNREFFCVKNYSCFVTKIFHRSMVPQCGAYTYYLSLWRPDENILLAKISRSTVALQSFRSNLRASKISGGEGGGGEEGWKWTCTRAPELLHGCGHMPPPSNLKCLLSPMLILLRGHVRSSCSVVQSVHSQ